MASTALYVADGRFEAYWAGFKVQLGANSLVSAGYPYDHTYYHAQLEFMKLKSQGRNLFELEQVGRAAIHDRGRILHWQFGDIIRVENILNPTTKQVHREMVTESTCIWTGYSQKDDSTLRDIGHLFMRYLHERYIKVKIIPLNVAAHRTARKAGYYSVCARSKDVRFGERYCYGKRHFPWTSTCELQPMVPFQNSTEFVKHFPRSQHVPEPREVVVESQ